MNVTRETVEKTLGTDSRYVVLKCEVWCKEENAEHMHRISSFHSVRSKHQSWIVKAQKTCNSVHGASPHQLGLFGLKF